MSMTITINIPKGRTDSLYVVHPDDLKVSFPVMQTIGEAHNVKITEEHPPCEGLVNYDDLKFFNFRGTHKNKIRVAHECIGWARLRYGG